MVDFSKLSQHDMTLSTKVKDLMARVQSLGATLGVQRLALVSEHFDKLSPSIAYHWIDPDAFQREIEEAQARKAERWHIWRIRFSLLPLLLTWFALFIAVTNYQQDLIKYPSDQGQPFLRLWQDGFHGTTPLTFAATALLDVVLLTLYLFFIIRAQRLEHRAQVISNNFSKELQSVIEELMDVITTYGLITGASDSYSDMVTNAIKGVIESAMDANKQLAEETKQAIINSNSRAAELFDTQITPMIAEFRRDMTALQTELGNYQGRLQYLTAASTQLADAALSLATNADRYTSIGQNINAQISSLNNTQQNVLAQIGSIAGSMGYAAQSVESVARELTTLRKEDIELMTNQIGKASGALYQVNLQLEQTTRQLHSAAGALSAASMVRGGFLNWLFGRKRNRVGGTPMP